MKGERGRAKRTTRELEPNWVKREGDLMHEKRA